MGKRIYSLILVLALCISICSCKSESKTSKLKFSSPFKSELASQNTNKDENAIIPYVNDSAVKYSTDVSYKAKKTNLPGYPKVVETKYKTSDVFIYVENVMDFGVKADGKTDDTANIQKALNRVGGYGGGTVYIPAGNYRIDGSLHIPHCVTLRGDFASPEDKDAPGKGTVIEVYGGKNKKRGAPAITIGVDAGLQGVTIYYPEQEYNSVHEYPATVSINHNDSKYGGHSPILKDVWFVNSYYIGNFGLDIDSSLHYISNVYGTPLKDGIVIHRTYDVGRVEGVYFSPQYLLKALEIGIIPSLSETEFSAAKKYIYENSIGITVARSDWEYIYNYNAEGLNKAIEFCSKDRAAGDGQLSAVTTINCKSGIYVSDANSMGWSISNSVFTSSKDDKDSYCIVTAKNSKKSPILFENCFFNGAGVNLMNQMSLSFENCSFNVESNKIGIAGNEQGVISAVNCNFVGDGVPIHAEDKVKRIQLVGCKYKSQKPKILKQNEISVVNIDSEVEVSRPLGYAHTYKATKPRPNTNNVYYLYTFGGKTGTDCTNALKSALLEAGKTGGTVYMPAGKFTISQPITIPSGVELRGCMENQYHTKNLLGTTIMVNTNPGEDLDPFISLSENSGINGFSICYPDQLKNGDVIPYSWAVQSRGKDTWAIAISLTDSYLGLDFGTYESTGHYINGVTGAPIKTGIYVDKNKGNGWIENVHFNPGMGNETSCYMENTGNDRHLLTNKMKDYLTAFDLGSNKSEHMLGCFVYAANNGIRFAQNGSDPLNLMAIGFGADNAINDINIEQCTNVEMINSELTVIKGDKPIHYINVRESNTGSFKIFNTRVFGQGDKNSQSFLIKGNGTIDFSLAFILDCGAKVFDVFAKKTRISSTIFYQNDQHVVAESTAQVLNVSGCQALPNTGSNLTAGMETINIENNGNCQITSIGNGLR